MTNEAPTPPDDDPDPARRQLRRDIRRMAELGREHTQVQVASAGNPQSERAAATLRSMMQIDADLLARILADTRDLTSASSANPELNPLLNVYCNQVLSCLELMRWFQKNGLEPFRAMREEHPEHVRQLAAMYSSGLMMAFKLAGLVAEGL